MTNIHLLIEIGGLFIGSFITYIGYTMEIEMAQLHGLATVMPSPGEQLLKHSWLIVSGVGIIIISLSILGITINLLKRKFRR